MKRTDTEAETATELAEIELDPDSSRPLSLRCIRPKLENLKLRLNWHKPYLRLKLAESSLKFSEIETETEGSQSENEPKLELKLVPIWP